jgi:membrane fusion protein (multidrug efflux system)
MKSRARYSLIISIAVVIIGAVALVSYSSSPSDGTAGDRSASPARGRETTMRVNMQVLALDTVANRVVTVGNILSNEEVEIRSEIAGRVSRILFREGSPVEAGQTLVRLNDDELQAQADRARARLAQAQQDEARQRQLFQRDLISNADYDNALTNLNLMKAEAQLAQAQLAKTNIRAPFAGTVGLRNVSEGSAITPTTVITTLQDRRTVKIDFSVPERYAPFIHVADTITFTVQGSARQFVGRIYAYDPKIDPGTRTLRLRATSSNRDGKLLPGSLASVELSFRAKPLIMIPSYALIPELRGQRVFLFRGGRAESQRVQIGERTADRIEVTDGLLPGDTLITSGILQLRPGMPVTAGEVSTKSDTITSEENAG